MAFRKPRKQPQFADLKGILAQSHETENPLYQTVQEIIERLTQLQAVTLEEIEKATNTENNGLKFASRFATFLTQANDKAILPNSFQLLAGLGITFDTSVPNQLRISSSGASSGADHIPMVTGAEPLEFMSDGAGSLLLIEFAEP